MGRWGDGEMGWGKQLPDERWVRTISPSRSDTCLLPSSSKATVKALAIVDFPAPDSPVKKTVNPDKMFS